ncbi:MAG: DUF1566 domain-containing protein [Candidatus Paceibacterota bacterium]|jgi:hypothetical protein
MIEENKKTLILSFVAVLLFSFVVFDRVSYKHVLKENLAEFLSGKFGTVGLSTIKIATSTTPIATSTITQLARGIPPESPTNYKDNGDNTITDNYTGLIWAKCVQGMSGSKCTSGSAALREWSKARSECERLNLGGNSKEWRMPTLKELSSIVDTGSFDPAINKTFFPNTTEGPYWTYTSPAGYRGDKFIVLFSDGSVYHQPAGGAAATRCVRTGK